MRETNEFAIEWIIGDKIATATVPEGTALNNKLLKLADEYPDDVDIVNSELFHIPASWVKVRPPKKVSDEQREAFAERMKRKRK